MNRYLTTPIYYASGSPHLGHAYTTLVADCFKRFYALHGDSVLLTTGTDEHGQKIERAAATAGVDTRAFVDGRSAEFEALWQGLDIDVDLFERTTSANHIAFAQAFWQRLVDNGDIYLGEYRGPYCVDCEQYFTEGETCPVHRKPLEHYVEPSYFFRLSRYRDALIEHIEANEEFIRPVERRNEVLAFLKGNELKDLSVSRASTRWGVPIKENPDHVQYVWVDALVTYISALALKDGVDNGCEAPDLSDPEIQSWWQHTTHFIGKDILTFHAVYWPALLIAAKLPLPKALVVNGWLTVEGRKIAKSDPATIVDPVAVADEVGRDGFKFYFVKAVTLGQDVDFSHEQLVQTINTDLVNNFGNLFSRFSALATKHFESGLQKKSGLLPDDEDVVAILASCTRDIEKGFASTNLARAARRFVEAGAAINSYFQQAAPWQIDDGARRETVLWVVHHLLADLSILATPFIPDTAAKARAVLCVEAPALWRNLSVRREVVHVHQAAPLYPRLGLDEQS